MTAKAASAEPQAERKKIKWSGATLHKRRHRALVKKGNQRIVINRSRMRAFNRQQTIQLLKAKGDDRNKKLFTQDFGRVTRCGAKAIDLLAQILEKHIAITMTRLKATAEHAGRKTVKSCDLKML